MRCRRCQWPIRWPSSGLLAVIVGLAVGNVASSQPSPRPIRVPPNQSIFAQADKGKVEKDKPEDLPVPKTGRRDGRLPMPFEARLPLLGDPDVLGKTPRPTPQELAEYAKYVDE